MKKRLLVVFALLLASTRVFGQQDPAITHFIFNKMSYNPAAAGLEDGICGTLIYRNQWDKVNGAPNTGILNLEGNIDRVKGGFGLSTMYDAIGFNRQTNAMLNYSYPIQLAAVGTLNVGLGLGLINFGLNKDQYVTPSGSLADPKLPTVSSSIGLDANFGIYFKATKGYYVGLSSTHLSASDIGLKTVTTTGATSYQMARHYYVMGGYQIPIGRDGSMVDIQGMLRTDLRKYSADINVRYIYKGIVYGGITYRAPEAVAALFGFNKQISPRVSASVGYSYDFSLSKLRAFSTGTHELMVKACYRLPPPPVQKSKDVRHL